MISRIRVADDRLQAGGSVDVRHGWDDVARLLAHRRHEQHEPRGQLPRRIVEAEEAAGVLHRHGRGEWPVRLAELDLRVHEVFHLGSARIGEDAAVAERARAEFEPPLGPADHLSCREQLDDAGDQRVLARRRQRRQIARSDRG